MSLSSGTRLGPYEIADPIGAGGMGEVYRARDTRLGRDVAVKVLPESLARDPDSLARFEREARAVGALSHPNIVSIHDVGSEGSVSYVVMELLEGETLRARLQSAAAPPSIVGTGTPPPGSIQAGRTGGLPRAKAIEIGMQIAQGLAAAHAKGIVHRDLKPENVFLTPDGRVKILDFGLARSLPGDTQAVSEAETVVSPATAGVSVPGMILGTVGYMAPEQVRGQPADHRADIFAFGAVLFEMLTGTRAFSGASAIETMSAILNKDPLEDPAAAVALSGSLEPLLRHCLEKQPDERFQSARDLAFQLQVIAGSSGATSSSAAGHVPLEPPRPPRRMLVPAVIALIAALAGLGAGWVLFGSGAAPLTAMTSTILLPPDVRVYPGANPARSGGLAVSRDGRQIAFVGATPTGGQIFVRAIDSSVARPVAGTEGGAYPVWSPDGTRLAFLQDGSLKQVPSDGGAPQVITEWVNPRSAAAWGPDGTLLYHLDYRQPLSRVSATGGPPSDVLPALDDNQSWFSPVWMPDGRHFLVVRFAYSDTASDDVGIYAGSVDSTDVTLVVPGRISEVALGDKELFYRKGTDLIAQPFDVATLTTSGNPRVISDHVSMVAAGGPTLVYFDPPGGLSLGHHIAWLSRAGAQISTTGLPATFRDPRLSPDERSIAVARADETGVFAIWKYDVARNIDTRVTGRTFVSPAWSRDSRSIIVGSGQGLFRFDADGFGSPTLIQASKTYVGAMDTSPDGRDAVVRVTSPVKYQPAVIPLDGRSDPQPIFPELLDRLEAAYSPDGKWIAMAVDDGSTARLHVQPNPGPGARVPVTAVPGSFPRWRGDGRELFFLTRADGVFTIMAVPVTWSSGVPDFGTAHALFKVPGIVASNLAFDVTKDGQKFVAIVSDELDPSPLTMVVRAAVR